VSYRHSPAISRRNYTLSFFVLRSPAATQELVLNESDAPISPMCTRDDSPNWKGVGEPRVIFYQKEKKNNLIHPGARTIGRVSTLAMTTSTLLIIHQSTAEPGRIVLAAVVRHHMRAGLIQKPKRLLPGLRGPAHVRDDEGHGVFDD
jgi:hypothetical protein